MKRSAVVLCLVTFAAVFAAHAGHRAWREHRVASRWVAVEAAARPGAWSRYVERQDYYIGFSYGLAAAFTVFALLQSMQGRRRQMQGVLGGLTLSGTLYAAGCYLIGCCGSPMLAVYLSLFGTSILGLLKPIVAGATTLSVVLGGFYIVRRSQRPCSPHVEGCSPARESVAVTKVPIHPTK